MGDSQRGFYVVVLRPEGPLLVERPCVVRGVGLERYGAEADVLGTLEREAPAQAVAHGGALYALDGPHVARATVRCDGAVADVLVVRPDATLPSVSEADVRTWLAVALIAGGLHLTTSAAVGQAGSVASFGDDGGGGGGGGSSISMADLLGGASPQHGWQRWLPGIGALFIGLFVGVWIGWGAGVATDASARDARASAVAGAANATSAQTTATAVARGPTGGSTEAPAAPGVRRKPGAAEAKPRDDAGAGHAAPAEHAVAEHAVAEQAAAVAAGPGDQDMESDEPSDFGRDGAARREEATGEGPPRDDAVTNVNTAARDLAANRALADDAAAKAAGPNAAGASAAGASAAGAHAAGAHAAGADDSGADNNGHDDSGHDDTDGEARGSAGEQRDAGAATGEPAAPAASGSVQAATGVAALRKLPALSLWTGDPPPAGVTARCNAYGDLELQATLGRLTAKRVVVCGRFRARGALGKMRDAVCIPALGRCAATSQATSRRKTAAGHFPIAQLPAYVCTPVSGRAYGLRRYGGQLLYRNGAARLGAKSHGGVAFKSRCGHRAPYAAALWKLERPGKRSGELSRKGKGKLSRKVKVKRRAAPRRRAAVRRRAGREPSGTTPQRAPAARRARTAPTPRAAGRVEGEQPAPPQM